MEIKFLKKCFSSKLEVRSIGITKENRWIPMLIFGYGEKSGMFTAGIHGRESINPVVLLSMAEAYLNLERKNEIYRTEGKIYLIPLLNPDGYEKARVEAPLWKENGSGLDINRNFPSIHFQKKGEEDYAGSEEETKALMSAFQKTKPDGYLDYHSRGRSIYYYRKQMKATYNDKQLLIGRDLSESTGYSLKSPKEEIEISDSGGNSVHYFSEYFKKPALTIETVEEEEEFPLGVQLQKPVYEEIKNTFGIFLDALKR
ncbi:MAG: M14 family zinc carboxypeptidase [Acetivibrio sp.]